MNNDFQYRIGVDVGGTFTDCVLRRPDGTLQMQKSPTTPDDQSDCVLAGLTLLAGGEGMTLSGLLGRTRTIVHGTTTGDNTMIQMTGAPTGLIVTRGFRDEIEFRRCYKEDIWDPARYDQSGWRTGHLDQRVIAGGGPVHDGPGAAE